MTPTKIIIHHSDTRDDKFLSWGAIRYHHVIELGWHDIGYHAGVELVQSGDHLNYEILIGRMWDVDGAHTIGQNTSSLGICFVGDYDEFPPPDDIIISGAKLIKLWMKLFNISINQIYAHRDFNNTDCPGKKFDINVLKGWLTR